jgi:hypothetical protein
MSTGDKDGKFFAVRDLPEHTRKQIKHYAVDHDLTMAQALEALIQGRYGSEEDRRFIDALLKVYSRVLIDDFVGAQEASGTVTLILEHRPVEIASSQSSIALPPPEPQRLDKLGPREVVETFIQACYVSHDWGRAALLLAENHLYRKNGLDTAAQWLQSETEAEPFRNEWYEIGDPIDAEPDTHCYIRVVYSRIFLPGTEYEHRRVVSETYDLIKEHSRWAIVILSDNPLRK